MESNIENKKLISLKESFIYPIEWDHSPSDSKFIKDCYNEAVLMGIFNIDDKKSFKYIDCCLSSCRYMWPKCNYEQSMITGRFIQWSFLLDDYLDSCEINDEITNSVVLNIESALIDGVLTNKNSKLEEYTIFLRNKLLEFCGKDRIDAFNNIINEMVICLWTLVPFSKIHNKEKDCYPSYQLYRCIRTVNVGIIACCALNFVIFPELNIKLWLNQRFRKILNRASIQISIVNDAVSFAKELLNENPYCNSFYFLQKEPNNIKCFDNVCKFLFSEANSYIKDIIKDEPILLKEFENDPVEKENVIKLLNHIHYFISGNFIWSLDSNRYHSSNSPFLETSNNLNKIEKYNKIIPQIYQQQFNLSDDEDPKKNNSKSLKRKNMSKLFDDENLPLNKKINGNLDNLEFDGIFLKLMPINDSVPSLNDSSEDEK